ncbi:MAG: cytochrome c1 [Burkholderiales bacterium]|jgi:ubiquinol-cytochrome c reductase cytochrome c1 subunit|nr:cytochrome c1 [Burkholderiales bacterium]
MTIIGKILIALLILPGVLHAAEEVKLDRAPIDSQDMISLQRGAHTFLNYCLGCHSANYMRYNRLQDLGLTEQQIRDNLIFTGVKAGDLMKTAMAPRDGKEWFGTAPPDLTVIARSRSSHAGSGADWLYTYMRSFYRDANRPTGWNNVVYPNVAMPHVLYELQGEQVLKTERVMRPEGYPADVQRLALEKKGQLSPVEYDRLVADLVNYLNYMAEPAGATRRTIGIYVLLFLGLFWVLAFALKKEYWKDVH